MPDGSPLIIGQTNTGTSSTLLQRSGTPFATAFEVDNPDGGDGIVASSEDDVGVIGASHRGPGVIGSSEGDVGIWGSSDRSPGVWGSSHQDAGVLGLSDENVGVDGTSADNIGVKGVARFAPGYGVLGFAPNAQLSRADGGFVISGVGVVGFAPNGTGIVGAAGPTGLAAYFDGNVRINGDATVLGAKSAAVRHPDGSLRRLYVLESPESYFEDFGRGKLHRGRARVKLDRDFAAFIRRDNYYVFLTAEGHSNGLYVSRKSPTGFEVREQDRGTSSLMFVYRVVARRKDIPGRRLEKVRALSLRTIKIPPTFKIQERLKSLKLRAERKSPIPQTHGKRTGPRNK